MDSIRNGTAAGGGYNNGQPNIVSFVSSRPLEPSDAQMDQIRDLLFGEFRRDVMERLAAMEARIADLERRFSAARAEDETKRRVMLDDIARGVATLGEHVRQIAKP